MSDTTEDNYTEGDLVTLALKSNGIRFNAVRVNLTDGPQWQVIPGAGYYFDDQVTNVRRQLVLDPEDDGDVRLLAESITDRDGAHASDEYARGVLRSMMSAVGEPSTLWEALGRVFDTPPRSPEVVLDFEAWLDRHLGRRDEADELFMEEEQKNEVVLDEILAELRRIGDRIDRATRVQRKASRR